MISAGMSRKKQDIDSTQPPTRADNPRAIDGDETLRDIDDADDLATDDEGVDPVDRRRDPLRRP
jgi:hypothetical protein